MHDGKLCMHDGMLHPKNNAISRFAFAAHPA